MYLDVTQLKIDVKNKICDDNIKTTDAKKRLGVSYWTLNRLLSPEGSNINLETYIKLCRFLKCSLDKYLL